jgi:hypothetical protein
MELQDLVSGAQKTGKMGKSPRFLGAFDHYQGAY